ncbi:hypothetical protein T11_6741 [Trichinella zimbabwensis]|uniref:Uncharacterized protein n=1 Tax=Trichinella zimbabwensis TaxID=268475 RepID=A0A0V1I3R1_9BILA|nr:hypothetical protein T11_6741 [Trichinella zimbabwensis]
MVGTQTMEYIAHSNFNNILHLDAQMKRNLIFAQSPEYATDLFLFNEIALKPLYPKEESVSQNLR